MTFVEALKKYFFGTGAGAGTDVATETSRVPILDASGNAIGSTTFDRLADLLLDSVAVE